MIEVSLAPHPYLQKKMQIFVGDKLWREMPSHLLRKCPLLGSIPSFSEWEKNWVVWEAKIAKQVAIKQLSIKQLFAAELGKKLGEYGFAEHIIDEILRELRALLLLDDEEAIQSFIRKAIREKRGPRWIAFQLQRKGVSIDTKEQLAKLYPEEMRKELIHSFIKKNKKEKQKVIRALLSRGFFLEEILQAYAETLSNRRIPWPRRPF